MRNKNKKILGRNVDLVLAVYVRKQYVKTIHIHIYIHTHRYVTYLVKSCVMLLVNINNCQHTKNRPS